MMNNINVNNIIEKRYAKTLPDGKKENWADITDRIMDSIMPFGDRFWLS